MIDTALHFFRSEDGALTLDWVVLTGVLVGTGFAVMSTVTSGMEDTTALTMEELRIQSIGLGYLKDYCEKGVDDVQRREDARVDAGGEDAINVRQWMNQYYGEMSDEALIDAHGRLLYKVAASSDEEDEAGWTRDRTISAAVECEISERGLD